MFELKLVNLIGDQMLQLRVPCVPLEIVIDLLLMLLSKLA